MDRCIDEYIEQYGRRLFGLCMHLCGNYEDAEDLYQETWTKAYASFYRYDGSKSFEPWLSKICMNTYRDIWRRRRCNPFYVFFQNDKEKDAALELKADETRDYNELADAVQCLNEKLRTTVILFYYYGFDIKETAETLRVPEGTVKSRLSAARKQLKELLKDEK